MKKKKKKTKAPPPRPEQERYAQPVEGVRVNGKLVSVPKSKKRER